MGRRCFRAQGCCPWESQVKAQGRLCHVAETSAEGVRIIDCTRTSRDTTPSVISTASDALPTNTNTPNNDDDNNPSCPTPVNATLGAYSPDATPGNESDNINIDVSHSEQSKNSTISFHNALSSEHILDPAATKVKSNPFLSQKRKNKNNNPTRLAILRKSLRQTYTLPVPQLPTRSPIRLPSLEIRSLPR